MTATCCQAAHKPGHAERRHQTHPQGPGRAGPASGLPACELRDPGCGPGSRGIAVTSALCGPCQGPPWASKVLQEHRDLDLTITLSTGIFEWPS